MKAILKFVMLVCCPGLLYKLLSKLQKDFSPARELIKKEAKSTIRVSLKDRVWALYHGFLSENVLLYGLKRSNIHDYLPEFPYALAHPFNGLFSKLIDDKLIINFVLQNFKEHLPEYYFLILRNQVIPIKTSSWHGASPYTAESVLDLCRNKGSVALKLLAGSSGIGFHKVAFDGQKFSLDCIECKDVDLSSFLRKLNNYIVTEYVQQHDYAKNLFPKSTNTIRVLTMRDYNTNKSFIAIAVHRIGRSCSAPVDNFNQGGLSCMVDLSSGILGKGFSYPTESVMVWYEKHPDTGQQITGTKIPHWNQVKVGILEITEYMAYVPYMGWDVVVTSDGFKITEINSLSDLQFLQVHRPLLKDERVRRFYARHIR
ncbi:MAG: hypothetical protein JW837_11815 [Sedimentisphaerales bacterium]|nr:hypothetical protein [Sedimentisphaerales bacterium]